jgi:hypothetical protein
MDPYAVAAKLEFSRLQLRALLLPGQTQGTDDVFPRSATMRFLLNPRRRRLATTALGFVASMLGRRRQRRTAAGKLPAAAGSLLALLAGARR